MNDVEECFILHTKTRPYMLTFTHASIIYKFSHVPAACKEHVADEYSCIDKCDTSDVSAIAVSFVITACLLHSKSASRHLQQGHADPFSLVVVQVQSPV